jgi:acid phosphatase type 7
MRTFFLPVFAALPLLFAVSCGSDDSPASPPAAAAGGSGGQGTGGAAGTGGSGGSGGASGPVFHATSCKYAIAPRMEYTEVFAPKTAADLASAKVSAAPDIKRIRLGLGGTVTPGDAARVDPTKSIAFAWETDLETTATTAVWGKSPDATAWSADDRVEGLSYVVEPTAQTLNGSPQRVHEAHVCGLEPNTTYYYRVGGGPEGKEVWSEVLSFRTLPAATDETVKVAVTGDSRGEIDNAWQLLQERLTKRGDIQMQLFSGDMIVLGSDQSEYAKWLDHGSRDTKGEPSALPRILSLLAMGNHENYQTGFFATVVQPDDREAQGTFGELFFSVDVGPAHFLVFDDYALGKTSIDPAYAPLLLSWLDADLTAAQAARAERPWIIAVHHHGEWTSSSHAGDSAVLNVRAALAPVWDKFGVDLVLDGHDHNYERSKPLKIASDGKPVLGAGTTYVVCAGSGADGYGNGMSEWTETSFSYEKKGAIGVYGILSVSKSKLSFEAHTLTAAGDDPVEDTFELSK